MNNQQNSATNPPVAPLPSPIMVPTPMKTDTLMQGPATLKKIASLLAFCVAFVLVMTMLLMYMDNTGIIFKGR